MCTSPIPPFLQMSIQLELPPGALISESVSVHQVNKERAPAPIAPVRVSLKIRPTRLIVPHFLAYYALCSSVTLYEAR